MTFERSLYAEGLHILGRTLPYALVVLAGDLGVNVLVEVTDITSGLTFANTFIWTSYFTVTTLIWAILAYAAHAEILLHANRDTGKDYQRIFGFGLRSLCLLVLMAIPFLSVAFLARFAREQSLIGEDELIVVLACFLLASVLMIFVVLVFLGTILPAYVADKGRGVRPALARGARQYLYIVSRLIVGPSVVTIILWGVAILPAFIFEPTEDVASESYLSEASFWTASVISSAIQTYATVLTAVILSRAFLRDQELEANIKPNA